MRKRMSTGGTSHLAASIEKDLSTRNTNLLNPHISGIADICASVLITRTVNTGEWILVLPRDIDAKSQERYISRLLANDLIDIKSVMQDFVKELITMYELL